MTPGTLPPNVYAGARKILIALSRDDEPRLGAALDRLEGDDAGQAIGLVLGALWNISKVSIGDKRALKAALKFLDLHQQEGR